MGEPITTWLQIHRLVEESDWGTIKLSVSVGYNACTVQMGYSPSTDSQTHLGFLWSSSSFHWSHTPPSPLQEVHTSVRPGTTDTAHVLTRASKCLSRIIVKGTCANQPVECCEASHIIHSDWETPIAKHQSYSPV